MGDRTGPRNVSTCEVFVFTDTTKYFVHTTGPRLEGPATLHAREGMMRRGFRQSGRFVNQDKSMGSICRHSGAFLFCTCKEFGSMSMHDAPGISFLDMLRCGFADA